MSTTVDRLTCPECATVLKPSKPVPVGKKITCPKCSAVFTAKSEAVAEAPKAKPAAKPKPVEAVADVVPLSDDEEDEGGTYGVVRDPDEEPEVEVKGKKRAEPKKKKPEINYAPDTSIRDLRGPAQAAVISPSNMVLITGLIGFLGWLVLLILVLIPMLFPLDAKEDTSKAKARPQMGPDGKPVPEDKKKNASFLVLQGFDLALLAKLPWYLYIVCISPLVLGMIYSGIICMGTSMIQNLDSRAWGIAASIMVCLPFNAGGFCAVVLIFMEQLMPMIIDDLAFIYLVGDIFGGIVSLIQLVFGIRMLVVLMSEDVIAGFAYKPD